MCALLVLFVSVECSTAVCLPLSALTLPSFHNLLPGSELQALVLLEKTCADHALVQLILSTLLLGGSLVVQLRCRPFLVGDQDGLETIELVASLAILLAIGIADQCGILDDDENENGSGEGGGSGEENGKQHGESTSTGAMVVSGFCFMVVAVSLMLMARLFLRIAAEAKKLVRRGRGSTNNAGSDDGAPIKLEQLECAWRREIGA
jgi:hypothetical protein